MTIKDMKEEFEKRLSAVDMTGRLKPYKKSLSASINEKMAESAI
ncbi:MAG: hypothetical protein QW328_07195 [Nitrososphaerota archaeon]